MKNNAKDLLDRYTKGLCTPEERILVESYYEQFKPANQLNLPEEELEQHLGQIWNKLPIHKKQRSYKIGYAIAAAVAVMLTSSSLFFYFNAPQGDENLAVKTIKVNDVAPGAQVATLTLADGSKISLNTDGQGKIASQAGVDITKTSEGKIVYMDAYSGNADEIQYNTIETPKGGEYELILPDGTIVKLNAGSSLKYPVSFKGTERSVTLNGEAFFKVAPDRKMPFKVITKEQEVVVLGTHFNINAYEENKITKTTLVEGRVNVSLLNSPKKETLRPGQLSTLNGNSLKVTTADIDSEIDWINGYFIFNEESLQHIMQKIARWYDVEVIYSANLSNLDQKFGGIVSRKKNLSVVLKTMERTGKVHFKLKDRQIIVLP